MYAVFKNRNKRLCRLKAKVANLNGVQQQFRVQQLTASSGCQADPPTVCLKLDWEWLFGGTGGKGEDMLKLSEIGMKITRNVHDGLKSVRNIWVQSLTICEDLDRDGGMNACGPQ